MTQEDKELLLKDLCARLPYGVKVRRIVHTTPTNTVESVELFNPYWLGEFYSKKAEFKPYLRPISSMTEEEMDKLFDILHINKEGKDEDWIKINDDLGIKFFLPTGKWVENVAEAYDFLYSIYIDFRGLIHEDLAIEAPENMY